MGTKKEGLGRQDLEVNKELRHSPFSQVESVVVQFEERKEREGREGQHTPETDLTRVIRKMTYPPDSCL